MMQTTIESTAKLTFILRRMRNDDLPAVVDFFNAVDAIEPMENNLTLAEFKEDYHWPDNQEIYILAHLTNPDGAEGRLIGYLECDKEDDTDMAWGELLVHPDNRNNGVGRALYAEFERLVLPKQPTELHFSPKQQATFLLDFLKRRGYEPERYFLRMRLPAGAGVPEAQLPPVFTVRTFQPGDEQLFTDLRNGTFADHYGSTPATLETMAYITQLKDFRPDGLFFAFADDEPAGFCNAGFSAEEIARRGIEVGWIHTLGVMPQYRQHGLGRSLLLMGIHWLRQFVPIVELGVEGKNVGALPLYTNVGFREENARVNMMKPVLKGEHRV
jgi:mycothiol synthase